MSLKDHAYCVEMSGEKSVSGSKRVAPPTTPNKPQVQSKKKNRTEEDKETEDGDSTLIKILNAVTNLSDRFDMQENKLESLATKMEEQHSMLTELKKEVAENKSKTTLLESELVKVREELLATKEKCKEQERYKRRWNLRLKGVSEKDNEDIKGTVTAILNKIAPGVPWSFQDMVDTVHRIGKKDALHTRQVIIQFVKRECRDLIWKLSKNCDVCKKNGLRFAEDLIQEDREARRLLWPKVKEAREKNKRAYFRGPFAFIENTQIFP
ncbi:putative LOC107395371-like protein [Nothobranchius furzeri]|uniref:LOC107395371-like protein n=1 Tax=Nothobranchius furzeri TaxID=105023 RepID=A0A9D2XJP1_NOTFU|nr:putative LOC107395371-like protein [Nothobranchius furzeri]